MKRCTLFKNNYNTLHHLRSSIVKVVATAENFLNFIKSNKPNVMHLSITGIALSLSLHLYLNPTFAISKLIQPHEVKNSFQTFFSGFID